MSDDLVFEPRASPPPLGDDEIHLWFFSTAAATPARAVTAQARTALERLLAAYAPAAQAPLLIARGARGKPYAPDLPELEFNLSHAGAHVALAFARGQALGVDLECHDRRLSLDDIAQRFFAPAEVGALRALEPNAKRIAFLRLWTHKEALLKALGEGLAFGLDRVEFALDREHGVSGLLRIASEAGTVADWQLRAFEPLPGVAGALAWRGPPRVLRAFAWTP